MGLKFGEKYTNTKSLRYGHLMIMTDQDVDGSHIKGLIINFIHFYWPDLLKIDGFMREFITPIVKAKKGKQVLTFFNLPEYYEWKKDIQDSGEKGWNIKYYKVSKDLELLVTI
jgi:DNA topoisomerase-2